MESSNSGVSDFTFTRPSTWKDSEHLFCEYDSITEESKANEFSLLILLLYILKQL